MDRVVLDDISVSVLDLVVNRAEGVREDRLVVMHGVHHVVGATLPNSGVALPPIVLSSLVVG